MMFISKFYKFIIIIILIILIFTLMTNFNNDKEFFFDSTATQSANCDTCENQPELNNSVPLLNELLLELQNDDNTFGDDGTTFGEIDKNNI